MADQVELDDGELPSIPMEASDEQTSEVDRIDKFARSEIFVQRLYHVCYMAEAAQRAGYDGAAPVFVPLCKELSVDEEPEIRQALAEQLPQLARIFAADGADAALRDVATLLQITNTLLTDDCEEVQLAAEQAFSEMAHVVRSIGGDMQNDMLGIVLELADSKEEAQRVCAANLLTGFAEGLEPGPFEERAVPKVIALAADLEFRVRKAVALGLPRCCKALAVNPSTVDELLLPVYVTLSQDTVWAVRMACAEGIVRIAEVVSAEARAVHLAATIERLARDPSNWVRDSALQMLGPLLAMLQGTQELSQRLVALFTSMAEPFPGDNRLRLYCAFNFPAVVQSLGPHRWQELEGAYRSLLGSEQAAVRRTLGYSLHELAQVLGAELSEAHLLPAFQSFMEDIDEVRMGVAKNLVPFIATLPKPSRVQCVQLLPSVTYRDKNAPASPANHSLSLAVVPTPMVSSDTSLSAEVPPPQPIPAGPPVNVVDSGAPLSGTTAPESTEGEGWEEEDLVESSPPKDQEGQESGEVAGSSQGQVSTEGGSLGQLGDVGVTSGGNIGNLYRAGSGSSSSGKPGKRRPVRVVDCRSLWHLRRLVAEQVRDIADLLDFEDVNSILVPFLLDLSRDPIAAVRSEAAKQVGRLASFLVHAADGNPEQSKQASEVLGSIRELATGKRFRDRQMFGVACIELAKGLAPPMFVDEILSSLVLASQDTVPNVRVRAAEALIEAASSSEELGANAAIQTALQHLSADPDQDVVEATELVLGQVAAEDPLTAGESMSNSSVQYVAAYPLAEDEGETPSRDRSGEPDARSGENESLRGGGDSKGWEQGGGEETAEGVDATAASMETLSLKSGTADDQENRLCSDLFIS